MFTAATDTSVTISNDVFFGTTSEEFNIPFTISTTPSYPITTGDHPIYMEPGTIVRIAVDGTLIVDGNQTGGTPITTHATTHDSIFVVDTGTSAVTITYDRNLAVWDVNNKKTLLKQHIRSNLQIFVKHRHSFLNDRSVSAQELKARDSLRDVITEREWRRYVTNGFLVVNGTLGRRYQIFKDQRHIKVYDSVKNTHDICIHTVRDCPPTDHVLNLKMLIELDEDFIWKNGNVYPRNGNFTYGSLTVDPKQLSLLEIVKQLKIA